MKGQSKTIIQHIGDAKGIGKIELIVGTNGGFVGDVPSVAYYVFDSLRKELFWNSVVCRGYWRPGKWKARTVANEVWAYYQSRGVETKVIDKLNIS